MSELRAPDPTLTELNPNQLVYVRDHADLPTAHKPTEEGRDHEALMSPTLAKHARWFAVPCRECFPDAGEHGTRECLRDGCTTDHSRYLSWQVPS